MTPQISYRITPTFPGDAPWHDFAWMIVESPSRTELVRVEEPLKFQPADFVSGVAFGERAELRWRKRRSGSFHLVLIADDGAILSPNTGRALKRRGRHTMVLWGEARDEYWQEARIPRPITEYPPEFSGSRLGVVVLRYSLEGGDGPVFLERFKGLVKIHT